MWLKLKFSTVVFALEAQFWFPTWFLFLLDRGFTLKEAALADGVFRLVATLAEVPMGWLSDRMGRKNTALLATLSSGGTFVLIASISSLPMLFTAWIAWGLSWALSSGFLTAYAWELGQLCRGETAASEFVRVRRLACSLAILLSVFTAGWAYEIQPALPFWITAALCFVALPVIICLPDPPRVGEEKRSKRVGHRSTWEPIAVAAVVLVAGWSIQMIFQPIGVEFGLGATEISYLFTIFALAQFGGAWLVGRLSLSKETAVVGTLLCISLSCMGVWAAAHFGIALVGGLISLVFLGAGFGYGTTVCDIWVARSSGGHNRAFNLSLVSLLAGIVMVVARPSLGIGAEKAGAAATFGVWGGVCFVASLAVGVLLFHYSKQKSDRKLGDKLSS